MTAVHVAIVAAAAMIVLIAVLATIALTRG